MNATKYTHFKQSFWHYLKFIRIAVISNRKLFGTSFILTERYIMKTRWAQVYIAQVVCVAVKWNLATPIETLISILGSMEFDRFNCCSRIDPDFMLIERTTFRGGQHLNLLWLFWDWFYTISSAINFSKAS